MNVGRHLGWQGLAKASLSTAVEIGRKQNSAIPMADVLLLGQLSWGKMPCSDGADYGVVVRSAFICPTSLESAGGSRRVDRVGYAPNFGECSVAERVVLEHDGSQTVILKYPQNGKCRER